MTKLEDQLRASLQAAAHRTFVPPPPLIHEPGKARRRLRLVPMLCIVIPSTAVLAFGGGYLPGSLRSAFSFPGNEEVDTSLQRAGAVPGPPGERLELWTRKGDEGVTCVLTVLVPADQPKGEPADAVRTSSGFCEQPNRPQSQSWGEGGGSDSTFSYAAGPAVRAEVLLGDGTRLAAVTAAGYVAGWVPSDGRDDAQLLGYDAAGNLLRSIDLTPWTPAPPPPPAAEGQGR